MHLRMMAIFLLFAFLGSGCRGVEKKEEVPNEAPAVQPVVEVLPEPVPAPIVEELVAPTEPAIEPAAAEPEDPETVALRADIAELYERYNALLERRERLRQKTDGRLDPLERDIAELRQAIGNVSVAKKEGEQ